MRQTVLKSLDFAHRMSRHASITQPRQNTFEWVYEYRRNVPMPKSRAYISNWIEKGDGMFLIDGEAGSGKSTLMKFIADSPRTQQLLDTSTKTAVMTASFYFDSTGTAMQNSLEGMFRTLLYEIFRQRPELVSLLSSVVSNRDTVSNQHHCPAPWTPHSLRSALLTVFTMSSCRFCFFIDGLDEYEGDMDALASNLQELASYSNVKLCVSSSPSASTCLREITSFKEEIYLKHLTYFDIIEYIKSCIQAHPRWSSLTQKSSERNSLVKEIQRRADGSFLWLILTMKILRDATDNRTSLQSLRQQLKSLPLDLEGLYRHILQSFEPSDQEKAELTLEIATAAKQPLHAMAYDFFEKGCIDADNVAHWPTLPPAMLNAKVNRILRDRTGSLLVLSSNSSCVQFLHRTVRDFL
ncbi:hypothetical protein GQ53DRAFT_672379, partial [Thozetella sp. PMI_491]